MDPLLDAAAETATYVQSLPKLRWFLDCDIDADGLCAAAVAATALQRAGHRFRVRASRGKTAADYEAVLEEDADAFMFLDKGASHTHTLAKAGKPVVVLDHHNVGDLHGVQMLNPRALGLDGGKHASASTTALAFAVALDARNWDLAPVALSGAIGDWQHRGGWKGWNALAIEEATARGHITTQPLPRLIGMDLAEALSRRQGLPGVTGSREGAEQVLAGLGIAAHAEAEDLSLDQRGALVTELVRRHLLAETDPTGLADTTLWNRKLGTSLRHVFRIADACGRLEHPGIGLAYLLGDRHAKEEALEHFDDYKRRLVRALKVVEERGTERRGKLHVVWTDDARLTGMVGGLTVSVVRPQATPLVILARRPDSRVQVSTRGTHEMVGAGLDLGAAVKEAAMAVGHEGGGHPIAAGTVLDGEDVEPFLAALDGAVRAQPWAS